MAPQSTASTHATRIQNTRARLHRNAKALVEGGDAAGLPRLHDAVNEAVELARLALAHICTHTQGRSAMQSVHYGHDLRARRAMNVRAVPLPMSAGRAESRS